jgi:hypothetical protein
MRSRRAYAAQMRALVAARQCPPWYEFNKLANGKRRRLQMQAATSRHGSTRAQSCPRRELKHCSSITGQISHGFITVERNGPDLDWVVSDLSHVSPQSSHDRRWRKAIEELNLILVGP